jgi:hypothetical protein
MRSQAVIMQSTGKGQAVIRQLTGNFQWMFLMFGFLLNSSSVAILDCACSSLHLFGRVIEVVSFVVACGKSPMHTALLCSTM